MKCKETKTKAKKKTKKNKILKIKKKEKHTLITKPKELNDLKRKKNKVE